MKIIYVPGKAEHVGYTICKNKRCYNYRWPTSVTALDDGLDSPFWVLRTDCCNTDVSEEDVKQREEDLE